MGIFSLHTTQTPSQNKWVAWLKEIAITVMVVCAVLAAIQWLQRLGQEGGGGRLQVGSLASEFTLKELDSAQAISLKSLRGLPTILNFWAPWCSACVSELPELANLTLQAEGRFHVITITQESPSVVRAFLENRGLSLRVLYDRHGLISEKYLVDRIPTTVILDAHGRVVHDFAGPPFHGVLLEHMKRLSQTRDEPHPDHNDTPKAMKTH